MEKLDLRRMWKHLYAPSAKKVEIVDVPTLNFAMIDGRVIAGVLPAESSEFQQAVEALYGVSFTLKFASKLRKDNPIDYPVMALEGLWWTESGEFDIARPGGWLWTLMIMQPDHITPDMFQEALQRLKEKKDNPALAKLRLEPFKEGLCIQTMHIGPYAEEPATVERMKAFARENGYVLCGKHHEIYLGDPRRAQPEKLKTVLRYSIQKGQV